MTMTKKLGMKQRNQFASYFVKGVAYMSSHLGYWYNGVIVIPPQGVLAL